MVLFKKETIVSNFFFKLLDCEKFLHNCNRQNIHVAETTCTPASAIFLNILCVFSAAYPNLQHSCVIFGNTNPQRNRDSLPGRYEGKTRSTLTNCPWSGRMGDNKSI